VLTGATRTTPVAGSGSRRNSPNDGWPPAALRLLTFSDGSSSDVADIADDGSLKMIAFDAKTVTWIKFQVTGGRGSNRGIFEIEASQTSAQRPTLSDCDREIATRNRVSIEDRSNKCACPLSFALRFLRRS